MRSCSPLFSACRKSVLIICTGIVLMLTSCFEAVEELTFSAPDKGSYKVTFNCSQSKIRLDNLLKLDTFMGRNIPSRSDLYDYGYRLRMALSKTPGIRKVMVDTDLTNYILTASFHFDSVAALNKAISNAFRETVPGSPLRVKNLFRLEGKTFSRIHHPADSVFGRERPDAELSKLLDKASFTSVFRFQSPVASAGHQQARVSRSGMAVMIKQSASEIIKNPDLLLHNITLK